MNIKDVYLPGAVTRFQPSHYWYKGSDYNTVCCLRVAIN
jgi:hypothetical protein